ncbi:hypothetical protein L484_017898 [Morus notabilis]|uniref:Homogentisate phytyltransferase 2 n=1 Tax=Morus notabilis TaxID=981085 RepID=W9SAT7_9ROSA|nr:hypothetical protein L484_017898 [Morus notabilis]
MDLPISHSPLGTSPFISQRSRFSNFQVKGSIPIKPTIKDIKPSNFPSSKWPTNKLIQPIGLYGDSRLSKPLLFGQHNRNYVKASAELDFPDKNQPDEAAASNLVAKVLRFGSSLWRFIRPYSMTQPFTASICLFARVLVENRQLFQWSLLFKAFLGLISVVLAFVYLNGINQIFDVEIDRYNIRTFAAQFGPKKIAFLGTSIILLTYAGAIVAAIYMPQARKLEKANYVMRFFSLLCLLSRPSGSPSPTLPFSPGFLSDDLYSAGNILLSPETSLGSFGKPASLCGLAWTRSFFVVGAPTEVLRFWLTL